MTEARWMQKLRGTTRGQRLIAREHLLSSVTETLSTVMAEEKRSPERISKDIGKNREFVRGMLRGIEKPTLAEVAYMFDALGYHVDVRLAPKEAADKAATRDRFELKCAEGDGL